jgi:hypothetical protein
VRKLLAVLFPLFLAGCASQVDFSKVPTDVMVSAANYSQVSGEDLYRMVNDPAATNLAPPRSAVPDKPTFYAFVPGDVYPADVPMETVFQELAVPLAHRGYFNVLYEAQAGYLPKRIDYLLRIVYGELNWRKPTVRTDKVTWGDDGLIAKWAGANGGSRTIWSVGPESHLDTDRQGLSPADIRDLATFLQAQQGKPGTTYRQTTDLMTALTDDKTSVDFALIVVEAFKFDDVWHKKDKAPCIWATYIGVPLHNSQNFSKVLRTMARSATPYFGETTDGIQVHDVPPGTVQMGEPTVVPDLQPQTK